MTKRNNPTPKASRYIYQVATNGGRVLTEYGDNFDYVACIIRAHEGPRGRFYSLGNFTRRPETLLETKKVKNDPSVIGLALIETERVPEANGQTFVVANGTAAGEKAIDWNDLSRYWKTRIANDYPGFESAVDVIEAEIITTPNPASAAETKESAAVTAAIQSIEAAGGPFSRTFADLMRSDGLTTDEKIQIRTHFGRSWPRFTNDGTPIGLPEDV